MSAEACPDARQKRSIYRVHYALPKMADDEDTARPHLSVGRRAPALAPAPPLHIEMYSGQVAGHRDGDGATEQYLGILKCSNGTLLKPIIKEAQKREIDFYETLRHTSDPHLLELRKYVPQYHGWKRFKYNGYENEYLILEDLTEGMLEPCIMDAKVGRRTWDPLAGEEKVRAEERKYRDCKREVAFCIPGFQVYRVATGHLLKYDKEYGKKLNGTTIREALKVFLNASGARLCRRLLLQLLAELWTLQRWAAQQTAVKLYSASLLLAYDARRLRECCGDTGHTGRIDQHPRCTSAAHAPRRRRSVHSLSQETPGSNFSGQLSPKGPVYRKISSAPLTSLALAQDSFGSLPAAGHTPWHEALSRLQRSHSFRHNYDENLSRMKMDYRAVLEQLSSESPVPKPWATVKIIDFVHAFFEEDEHDYNFSEGIDNIVKIFEEFLRNSEDS